MIIKFKKISLVAAALAVVMLLSSCALFTNTLEYDKETNIFTDKKTGIDYTDAPSCYEAASIGDAYAKWKNSAETVTFYQITGLDPKIWLAEEGKTVFYSTDIHLPSLSEMEPTRVLICVEQTVEIALVEVLDADDIAELVGEWESGEPEEYVGIEPMLSYRIKFESEKYPGIYYNLIYIEYDNGDRYLYRRDDGRFVRCGDLIAAYMNDDLT